jgi:hypothetical protein
MNSILGKTLTHVAAVIIFAILAAVYFRPQLSGKVIEQSDIVQYIGMSEEARKFEAATGQPTLWTNAMFGGMPTYQINTVSAGNNLKWLGEAGQLFISEPIGQFILAMLSFYILLIVLRIDPWLSVIGAVAFGFATNNFILYEAGHLTKVKAIAYFPLIAAGMLVAFKGRYLWGGLLFAVGLGLNISANHIQMSYYLALTMLFFGAAQLIYDLRNDKAAHFLKAAGALIVGAALAIGANASNLMTTYEYSRDTMRGKPILTPEAKAEGEQQTSSETEGLAWDYAMQWSNGGLDVLAGFIPGVAGGGSAEKVYKGSKFYEQVAGYYRSSNMAVPPNFKAPLYHGSLPFTSGPIYFGAVVCFLFILGLFTVKGPVKWWLGLGVLLTLLLSMGKNLEGLNRFFFDYVPLYNKFRTPNSITSITSFLMPLLAFLALGQAIKSQSDNAARNRALYISAGICAAVALFFAVLGPSFFDFSMERDSEYVRAGFSQEGFIADRIALMRKDAFRSLMLVLFSAGLLWAYWNQKIKAFALIVGLGVLVLFDVWSVGRRYLDEVDFVERKNLIERFNPTPADELILKDVDPNFRVYDRSDPKADPFASSRASYFHKSLGGYHAAKLQRYQDLIDRHLRKGNMKVFNMLNTKYFIVTDPDEKPVVETNMAALGNAWFVSNVRTAPDANAEIAALEDFDPEEDAVVHQEFKSYVEGFRPQKDGTIRLTGYKPNRLSYQTSAQSEQLAVFSEIWYGPGKGWQAYIDGQKADHIRANYVLRAMRIPAGNHTVEFVFEPASYNTGKLISLASSSVLLLGLIGFLGFFGHKLSLKWQEEARNKPARPQPKTAEAPKRTAAPLKRGPDKKKRK